MGDNIDMPFVRGEHGGHARVSALREHEVGLDPVHYRACLFHGFDQPERDGEIAQYLPAHEFRGGAEVKFNAVFGADVPFYAVRADIYAFVAVQFLDKGDIRDNMSGAAPAAE